MSVFHWSSFATGTSILLSDGTTSKNIEDIVIGDHVYSGRIAQGSRSSVVKQIKTSTPTNDDPVEVFHIHTDEHGHLLTTTKHQAFLTIEGWQCIDSSIVRRNNSYPYQISKYNLQPNDFFLDDSHKNRYRISQITQDVSTETQIFLVLAPLQTNSETCPSLPGTDLEQTSFIANGIVTQSAMHMISWTDYYSRIK